MNRWKNRLVATVTGLVLLAHVSTAGAAPTPLGAATPQALVERMMKAAKAKNIAEIVACLEPASRHEMTLGLLVGATMFVAFMGMGSAMTKMAEGVGEAMTGEKMKPADKAKLEKGKSQMNDKAEKAKAALSAVLVKHGLPDLLDEKVKLPEDAKGKGADALFKNVDEPALAADLLQFMGTIADPKDKKPADDESPIPELKDVKDYRISGNTATAKAGAETLDFVKIDDRWFFKPPEKKPAK